MKRVHTTLWQLNYGETDDIAYAETQKQSKTPRHLRALDVHETPTCALSASNGLLSLSQLECFASARDLPPPATSTFNPKASLPDVGAARGQA